MTAGTRTTTTDSTRTRQILASVLAVVAYLCNWSTSVHKTTSQDDVTVGYSNAAISSVCLSLHLNWSCLSTQKFVCDGISERTSRLISIHSGHCATSIINGQVIVDCHLSEFIQALIRGKLLYAIVSHMRWSRNRIVSHLSAWVQRRLVVHTLCSTVRCHWWVSSCLQSHWFYGAKLLLTLICCRRNSVCRVSLWVHNRVRLWIHWCSDGLHSMTCIWARGLIQ